MRIQFWNVRNAEDVHYIVQGKFFDFVPRLQTQAEAYHKIIDAACLPDVGDVVEMKFIRRDESTVERPYLVLGRIFHPYADGGMGVDIYLHNEDEATNKNWGDEGGGDGGT